MIHVGLRSLPFSFYFSVSIIIVYTKNYWYLRVPVKIQILLLKPHGFNDQEKGKLVDYNLLYLILTNNWMTIYGISVALNNLGGQNVFKRFEKENKYPCSFQSLPDSQLPKLANQKGWIIFMLFENFHQPVWIDFSLINTLDDELHIDPFHVISDKNLVALITHGE